MYSRVRALRPLREEYVHSPEVCILLSVNHSISFDFWSLAGGIHPMWSDSWKPRFTVSQGEGL